MHGTIAGLNPGDVVTISGTQGTGLHLNGISGTIDRPIIISMEPGTSWDIAQSPGLLVPGEPLIRVTGCEYVHFKGLRLNGGFPASDGTLPMKKSHGMLFEDGCQNIKVLDSVISGFPGSGTYVENTCLDSIDFYNTTFSNNGQNGLSHGGRSRNMVVRCRFIGNGNSPEWYNGDGKGLGLNCGDSWAMFNYFEGNGSDVSGDDFDISCDGESGWQTNQPVYLIGNYLKNCKQGGISLFGGVPGSVVRYNIIDGFNTVPNAGESAGQMSAIRIGKATPHTSLYHDTGVLISDNLFMNGGNAQPSAACIAFGLESGADQSGIVIEHNTFLSCSSRYYTVDTASNGVSAARIDNNTYYNADGVYTDKWVAGGEKHDSFDQWRSTLIFTQPPDVNGRNVDPGSIDAIVSGWCSHIGTSILD